MLKKGKIFLIASVLLGGVLSTFPTGVYAEAVTENAELISPPTSWTKEAGKWKYIGSNGNVLTGWHYLPARSSNERMNWYLFDSNGELVTFSPRVTGELFGTLIDEPASSIEPAIIKNGWYEISGKDGYYLEGTMAGDYRILKYSDGNWSTVDAQGVSDKGGVLSLKDKSDESTQKWWASYDSDGSYTLINEATGLQLDTSADAFAGYRGADKKSVTLKKAGVRPEYFGAVGDGVTDDTEAIRKAIASGNTVEFNKRYNTSETITIEKDNMTFIGGDGMIVTHPGLTVFRVKGKNVTFDNVLFMGSYSRDEATDQSCIFFRTTKEDEEVVDYNAKINNCKFINTGLRGVHIHSQWVSKSDFTPSNIASNITIKDCTFDGYKIGVCCSGPDYVTVDHCTFSNAWFEHITFDWRSRHCKAINNTFNRLEGGIGSIGVDAAEDIEIRNNNFYYSVLYGVTLSAETRTNKNVIIEGNTFNYDGGIAGILFNRHENGDSADDVLVKNNTFNTGNSYSIKVESAGSNIVFEGNTYNKNTPVIENSSSEIKTDF